MADPPYVFVGGVDVSRACLEALCEMGLVPRLAVGYGQELSHASGHVDLGPLAERYGFQLVRTAKINDPSLVAQIAEVEPAVVFVIGWSQLLRAPLLQLPSRGSVGIHPTDLPRGRGRAPIPWTILKGLTKTASTMFFLTEGVDDGDIVGKVRVEVDARETAGTLYAKHRDAHVELIKRFVHKLLAGTAPRTPQNEAEATYWEARSPDDGVIDPTRSVAEVDRLIRAVGRPFPGAFLPRDDGSHLVVWRADPVPRERALPGQIGEQGGVTVLQCADGALALLETEVVRPGYPRS